MAQRAWKSQIQPRKRNRKRHRPGARATAGYRVGSVASSSFVGRTFMLGVSKFDGGQGFGGS